ncbi:hypothetical protein ACJ73_08782 [Blastomyces percursus]|uniref:Protein kinase domain-containing protein n=1 Tax=Blastomyces percursus TaxID=1658174 RepID=A0A1J9PMC0_9EURO|nr:hypothetical protein ACJ73_08782 [Blastomyces percursus]
MADLFNNVKPLDIVFLKNLRESKYSAVFKVQVDGKLCVMKVHHNRGSSSHDPPYREMNLFIRESTPYRRLKAKGLCNRGVIPDFYGIITKIKVTDWLDLHIFHEDKLPPNAILIEYILNMQQIDLSTFLESYLYRFHDILCEIHKARVYHGDVYPRNMMILPRKKTTRTFLEEGAPTSRQKMLKIIRREFLGMKDVNTFWLPEIIYEPTLSPSIKCPEDLYSLRVLNGLNQQELLLRDDLADQFVFCSAVREGDGVRIAHEIRLTTASVRGRMRKGGEITGSDVSDSLQNLMLQHTSIDMFLKHYLDRNINADVLSIYRGLEPQKALMRMVCSMSRSINPCQPWKLPLEQSRSVPAKHPEDLSGSAVTLLQAGSGAGWDRSTGERVRKMSDGRKIQEPG